MDEENDKFTESDLSKSIRELQQMNLNNVINEYIFSRYVYEILLM